MLLKEIPLVMAAGVELVGKTNPWMIWTGDNIQFSLYKQYSLVSVSGVRQVVLVTMVKGKTFTL